MTDAGAKRRYVSPRREEQAASTRAAILEAAHDRFVADGYVGATIDAIAADAGVASKTVYAAFTTKARLLRAVWDLRLKGDVDDAPVAARPWYQAILDERDGARKLALVASGSCAVKRRIGPLLSVIRSAAVVDADGAALWELIQDDFLQNQRVVIASLHEAGQLRAELDEATAADVLWTLNHPDVWLLLVGRRGWAPERFEAWFLESARQQLLRPPARRRASPPRRGGSRRG